jgi:hypothetical protein
LVVKVKTVASRILDKVAGIRPQIHQIPVFPAAILTVRFPENVAILIFPVQTTDVQSFPLIPLALRFCNHFPEYFQGHPADCRKASDLDFRTELCVFGLKIVLDGQPAICLRRVFNGTESSEFKCGP